MATNYQGDGFVVLQYAGNKLNKEKMTDAVRRMEGAKAVATPCVKPTMGQIREDVPLAANKLSHFRALAARCNYLAADRPDCIYAAKEICRFMSEPTKMSVEGLKRIGRYLTKYPRLVYHYPFQDGVDGVDVYVDTDHAGCLRTRKSTSGGIRRSRYKALEPNSEGQGLEFRRG